ncbi:hypothetical protein Tco_0275868 [Tanacetum coccineum]
MRFSVIAGVQADLQATKGLIQVGHNGCGDETASPIPRSMRLGVPKFSGTDLDRWIFSITEYFTLLSTMMDQRLRVVGFNLEGGTVSNPRWLTELLVSKQTTLGDSFSLARIREAHLGGQGVSLVNKTAIVNSGGGQNQKDNPELVKPVLSATPLKPTSNSNEDANADQDNPEDQGDALESGDISILSSLVGNGSPWSLQLWGTIGSGNIHVLIDNGNTHNFVQPGVVERMKLAVSITKSFKVYIRSGETLY